MQNEAEVWVICPVCGHPNPRGTGFCRHCWGATLHSRCQVIPAQELEHWRARLKIKKRNKILIVSLVAFVVLAALTFSGLYYLTDVVSPPLAGLSSDSLPGNWAMFQHDPARSGIGSSNGFLPQGAIAWVFATGGPVDSSPAVSNGTVYIGSSDHKLYAVDTATGRQRWEFETGSWVSSSPAIVNGAVYFGSNDGKFYALNAQNGEKLWDFKTRYPIQSSPAVASGVVYVGTGDYYLYALRTADGAKLWDFKTLGTITSSPVVANGIVYTGSGGGYSYALDARNGRLRLRFNSPYPGFASPTVNDKVVYFNTDSGYLFAVDGNARTWPREHEIRPYWTQAWLMRIPGIPKPPVQSGLLWQIKLDKITSAAPTVKDDTIYVATGDKLVAIDLKNLQQRWEFETKDTIRSSPVVTDTAVYFGSEDGYFHAVDAITGEKLWDLQLGGAITSSPALVDGTIYVSSQDGKLYAIK
ncbi:MAG: PQQ-binding-like beta-propeller repeat protein [Chloroflexi bacterium]|nr:PQQ-binding-like beta-propeller repeat protein [Chloroflexota bacterium]